MPSLLPHLGFKHALRAYRGGDDVQRKASEETLRTGPLILLGFHWIFKGKCEGVIDGRGLMSLERELMSLERELMSLDSYICILGRG